MSSAILNTLLRCTIPFMRLYIRYFPVNKGKAMLWDVARRVIKPRAQVFGPRCVRTVHGLRMRVDMSDIVQRRIYFWGEWEPGETWLLRRLLKAKGVFVDIGANIGYFSLLASRELGDKGEVIAFEPTQRTRSLLETNIALNACTNIRVLPYAVSDTAGEALLFQNDNDRGGNTLRSTGGQEGDTLRVETVTLDGFLDETVSRRISLIKIDVEGAELMALKGMKRLLSQDPAPDVLCEVTDGFLRQLGGSESELCSYMKSLGYNAFVVSDDKLTPLNGCLGVEQYDALFTKRDIPLERI